MTRHRNDGLRKLCDCPRRSWAKCSHPWHFNFKWKGTPYRFSLDRKLGKKITSKTDAETEADAIRTAIRNGTFDTAIPVRETLTLAQLFNTFVRERLAIRQGGARINDMSAISAITSAEMTMATGETRPFGAWLVADVTTAALEQFRSIRSKPVVVERKGRGSRRIGGPVGVNRLLGFIRRVFNWAILAGYMETTPFKRGTVTAVKLPREEKRTRRLREGEEDRLLAVCGPHLRAVVECALETGMRRGEILGLRWMHVQAGEIRLGAAMTKTRTGRTIPISSRLQAILALRTHGPDGEPLSGTAYVFGNEIGQQVASFDSAWLTACAKAGIDSLHFHDLRREAGSRWLEGGVPLHTVRDWLGHTSIAQTSTYLAGTMKTQHDAMRQYDARRGALQQFANLSGTEGQKPTLPAPAAYEKTNKNAVGRDLH